MLTPSTPRKSMLMDMASMMITVAALLAGFSLAVATSVNASEVREFVTWEVGMFVGRHSGLCQALDDERPFAVARGERLGFGKNETCDSSGCWTSGSQWGNHCAPDTPEAVARLRERKILEKTVEVHQQLGVSLLRSRNPGRARTVLI